MHDVVNGVLSVMYSVYCEVSSTKLTVYNDSISSISLPIWVMGLVNKS